MYRMHARAREPALRRRAAARRLHARHRRDARGDRARAARAGVARVSQQPDRQRCSPPRDIERILAAAPGLVAVDEAYYAFADASFLPRVLEFAEPGRRAHAVEGRAWPGVRLGYAAAHPAWIAELDKVRPPYNVNTLTQAVVPVLLRHARRAGRAGRGDPPRARARRARRSRALRRRHRVSHRTPISCWCACPTPRAGSRRCADAGILVKNVDGWHPLLAELPAHHRRHARREQRGAGGAVALRLTAGV